jgi:hypothetical protein
VLSSTPPWQASSITIVCRPSIAIIVFELRHLRHGSRVVPPSFIGRAAPPSSLSSASSTMAVEQHCRPLQALPPPPMPSSAMADELRVQWWIESRTNGGHVKGRGPGRRRRWFKVLGALEAGRAGASGATRASGAWVSGVAGTQGLVENEAPHWNSIYFDQHPFYCV